MYNSQITEDGCVYTTRMIVKGMELLCTYVHERMTLEQEQENFVEVCSWHVQARYGETRPEKKFMALSEKYSREGDGDVSRNRKHRVKKKRTQVKRKLEYSYKGSGVAMWKSSREERKSGRTSSGIHGEKKLSRLLKVGKRSTDSSESESFEALETKLKLKFSVVTEKIQSGHNTVTKSHNVGTRLFSGFLVSFASGVVEWNCWMKQQPNTQKQGHLWLSKLAVWVLCMGHRA